MPENRGIEMTQKNVKTESDRMFDPNEQYGNFIPCKLDEWEENKKDYMEIIKEQSLATVPYKYHGNIKYFEEYDNVEKIVRYWWRYKKRLS